MTIRSRAARADVLLLIAAAIWGTGFVAQREGNEHMGPLTFNALRFGIGSMVLLPLVAMRWRVGGASSWRAALIGGTLSGLILGFGAGLQQVGLVTTTAGKAAFITGLYVLLVPIIGLVLAQRTKTQTWIGAALATGGLYLLSVGEDLQIERGDALVLACAVVWAVHVLVVAHVVQRTEPIRLAAVQFVVAAVASMLVAMPSESMSLEGMISGKWPVLYAGVFSVGVAFTLQVVGQRDAPPSHAAILLSMEAVFGALAGALLLSETMTDRQLVGCFLMLGGIVISQLRRRRRTV